MKALTNHFMILDQRNREYVLTSFAYPWHLVRIRIRILFCGSMPLTNWSGSGSCSFRHWPSGCQLKTNLKKSFSAYFFLKVHFHHFSKIKSKKKSQNSRNHGFAYYFCLMTEGSGFVHLTKGSGSGSRRPKTSGSGSGALTVGSDCCRRRLTTNLNLLDDTVEGSGSGSRRPEKYGPDGSGSLTLVVLTVADDLRDEPEPVGQLLPGERARPRRGSTHSARRRSLGFFAGRKWRTKIFYRESVRGRVEALLTARAAVHLASLQVGMRGRVEALLTARAAAHL